ncbi:hypothetical protein [Geobacter sp. DSM 9736]|uniref:hypothetical protein n=1 Tax=Geobacter sp. DSM 9736 TaxID=1277350 RepID=UPI000B5DE794|nr:hypothetical protein [Geobacter sp. DSM 9736]SNB46670.1 hypothetical protein SAMN06269301_2140 [Geobacter sp. DSM 9736]
MGILVCYDDFTYDVVADFTFDTEDGRIAGYDNSCDWEKVVMEEFIPLPPLNVQTVLKK